MAKNDKRPKSAAAHRKSRHRCAGPDLGIPTIISAGRAASENGCLEWQLTDEELAN
jgi:hypothetical protein